MNELQFQESLFAVLPAGMRALEMGGRKKSRVRTPLASQGPPPFTVASSHVLRSLQPSRVSRQEHLGGSAATARVGGCRNPAGSSRVARCRGEPAPAGTALPQGRAKPPRLR